MSLIRDRFDSEARAGLAFAGVPAILFVAFFVFPLLWSAWISMFNWGLFGPDEFVGVGNYAWLLKDPYLHKAVRNTVVFTAIVVPGQMALGLSLAMLVNQGWRGEKLMRAAFYFPAVASSAAVTMIAMFLLSPGDAGVVNKVLGLLHLPQPAWLADASTALPSLMGLAIWTGAGPVMLFYLAALQAIDKDLYEAADVEGATIWERFRTITLPILKPTHFFIAVLCTIGTMKIFDQAFIVSKGTGGPNYSTMTIVLYIYRLAFADTTFGYAAAVGVAFFIAVFALALIQRRLFAEPEGVR